MKTSICRVVLSVISRDVKARSGQGSRSRLLNLKTLLYTARLRESDAAFPERSHATQGRGERSRKTQTRQPTKDHWREKIDLSEKNGRGIKKKLFLRDRTRQKRYAICSPA